MELRQSAAASLRFPMIDDMDFKTPEVSLTYADLTCRYAKAGDTSLATKSLSSSNTRHLGQGIYEIDFTAAELDTLGAFMAQVTASGALPYYREDQIVPPALSGVTIHTETAAGAAIPGVHVQVRDSAGTAVLAEGTTDTDGDWIIGLPDGTYTVYLWLAGYTFAASPATLVVSGDATEDYTGADFAPSEPGGPTLTTVWGYLLAADGSARSGITVTFTPVYGSDLGRPLAVTSVEKLMTRVGVEVTTDAGGYFEVQLVNNADVTPSGTRYLVEFEDDPEDSAHITVTAGGPFNIEDLI